MESQFIKELTAADEKLLEQALKSPENWSWFKEKATKRAALIETKAFYLKSLPINPFESAPTPSKSLEKSNFDVTETINKIGEVPK